MTTELIDTGRFAFGKNWKSFLKQLSPERISTAEESLREMLGVSTLTAKSFLDIGSGSGLFSLAARKMGASVHSFDYDSDSVVCTAELRRRYFPDDPDWIVEQGSVLDASHLERLRQFDIVYSWGVLHHTGEMWNAISMAAERVAPGGMFFIAIYNDQGWKSSVWTIVKRTYVRLPKLLRTPYVILLSVPLEFALLGKELARGQLRRYVRSWTSYQSGRGMSRWHDVVDWMGGYPFEVAKPSAIRTFCEARGFILLRETTVRSQGCNQFVFRRADLHSPK